MSVPSACFQSSAWHSASLPTVSESFSSSTSVTQRRMMKNVSVSVFFFFLTLSHSSPWKQPPEIFVSGSLITRKARVWVFLHLACLCVRVTDWFSLFGFSFRWVFARVLLIPQKPRRSKGADGKNSQSEPAWIPWKIPLSVREPASLTLHLSLSLNGVVPAVRTLANCNLHLSFISAWLPFCQGILRHF